MFERNSHTCSAGVLRGRPRASLDRRSRRRRSCDGTPPARVITPMRVQRRIPPDDAIKSPNERMPTGATGRFAPATSRHPPLSRRTRRVLANTDSHDRFDLSRTSIRRVRHVHFLSCRATHETSRATGDRRKFTHPFFIPASHYFPAFSQHSVIDRMTTTSHLSTDFI
ncbi:hypothetical protein [Burkholderia vietnamiensis]|uniref:hypothetical protein n=1 Tax=Burkholderia vietnamiensis TaxID=60552 RepID=UPI00158B9660|nr:hypothetical protein [Burkholderia vietnamiensis]